MSDVQYPESDIAIVGMSGRFPGASDPDVLWARVVAGEDCLVDLDPELLIADGVPAHIVRSPDYVTRSGVLADVDMFDPGFFGIGRRDAAIMDPQHRYFLECVWEAIESSGHVPERFAGAIGVFAGCGANTYMLNNLLTNPQLVEQVGWFLLRHTGNDKDFLATTASYKLDLRGPSVNVQTACSTSLVAVHLAVQSLLGFECDLAVAGGVTIEVPHARGYEYREGEVLSPDGVCHAFDVDSAGTVLTSGAGVVALRRLQDAVDDGDPILAVIKGSAINNDGARKVGYLAPSVDGHADVVKEALAVAGIDARSITLLEAHGTGTAVGDPIEVAALTEAFRASTPDSGFCRLVSTKPNIGHLDTAAGTASLIKAVQALRHRTLPPMANHGAPSPLLDIERTPFVLSDEAAPWESSGPRRVGISSLGVGGTNAHVIVEEAPELEVSAPAVPEQVLVISGRDPKSVSDASERLAVHLEANPDTNLADVAATLITGRRAMRHRRIVVATDVADAIVQLRGKDRGRTAVEESADDPPGVAFMFPGGGSQYVGMAAGFDDRFDVFHATLRQGFDIVRDTIGLDLAPIVAVGGDDAALRHPGASLPAVFVTSVALARQWMAWGVTPRAFVGHSLGEYVAAHLAGVLSFEDALSLVITRSQLMEGLGEDAAMLAVPLPEAEVIPMLGSALSLATVNTRDECVVAGRAADIEALNASLPEDVEATLIPIVAAGHSSLLDPILPAFLEAVRKVSLSAPTMPYVSNLTGQWITAEQATDPQYWVDHLRHTVRFADCLATVLADGPIVLAELGPGHALSSFARRADGEAAAVIPGLRHPNQVVDDTAFSLMSFARLWGAGVDVDLERFAGTGRRRLRLPTYAFQRERFWIEPGAGYAGITPTVATDRSAVVPAGATAAERPRRIDDLDDVFWIPSWQACDPPSRNERLGAWLVVGDEDDALVGALVGELVAGGARASAAPAESSLSFDDALDGVVIVAPIPSAGADLERSIERWLDHGTAAARALGGASEPGRLVCVSRDTLNATGPATHAVDALAAGVVAVAPREYPGLTTRLLDVDEAHTSIPDVVDDVLGDGPQIVALRSGGRLTPVVERGPVPAVADAATFRRGGTYLVTGAFGGVGSVLASHLVTQHEANLVLLSTDDVPEAALRDRWLATHSYDDPTSRRIRTLRQLEASGTKIAVVVADVADPAAVRRALDEAERRVGPIDGAIHAAGRLRDRLIEMAEPADHRFVIEAKAGAALTLVDELERRGTQLLVLVSSTSTLLQPDGQTSYVAANSVLDALAGQHGRLRVCTINFGLWANVGIASDAGRRAHLTIDDGEPVEHPVLSERSQGRDGTVRLIGRLDSRHHWVVDEHRVPGGNALLPGTGHLELMLAGARLAGHALLDGTGPQLSAVALLAPLVVRDGRPTTVRVTVTPGDRPTVSIESDGGTARSWIMHSEARITAASGVVGPYAMDDPMLDGVDPLAGPRRHLALGPHWDAVVDARLGDGVAIADLRLAEPYSDEPGPWQAHPALVDVATAVGVALAPPHDESVIYVPIGYERVWMRNPLPASVRVRARRSSATSPDLLRVDLLGLDDAGEAVMDIVGLDLLPVTQHGHLAEVDDDAVTTISGHAAPLIELADELGIRAHEGVEMVERLLAGQHPRLIGSTIDVDDLRRQLDRDAADEPTTTHTSTTSGTSSGVATAEDAIRMMWVELLGVDEIADDDDFFELGGHSLVAIRLMSRIHKELSVRLQLATIFEASTVGTLANKVRENRPDIDEFLAEQSGRAADAQSTATASAPASTAPIEMTQHLVPITSAGPGRPLYIVHGAGGNVLFLWSLARAMAGERPILGFQAHGIEGHDLPDTSIEVMAARYVAELRAYAPGPYLLGGFSGGGLVALEMTRQLRDLGETVDLTVLFDSPRAGEAWPGRTQIWRRVAGHMLRRGIGPLKPYLRSRVKSSILRFVPALKRHNAEHEQDEIELGLTDTAAHGFVNLFYYFGATAEKYQMTSYPSDVLLLKADMSWPTQTWDYGWGEHVEGRLDIRVVPGDHNSMFYPENAPALARVLTKELIARD